MPASKAPIEIEIFSRFEDLDRDWAALAPGALGTPYQTPAWLSAWSATLGTALAVSPVLAVGRVRGQAVFCLPFGLQKTPAGTSLSFLGHQNGNQNTGLWAPDFYAAVDTDQITHCLKDVCAHVKADMLVLHNVPETWHGRPHPLILEGAAPSPSPDFARALPLEFERLFQDTHSKSSRKNLLRKQRHLQAAGGYRAARATEHVEIAHGLDAFLEQRALRAKEAGIPNVFSSSSARQFLKHLLGLAGDGTGPAVLDLWTLEVDGKIRATYLCAEHSGTLYAFSNSVAHDDFLPNSPGLVLIKEIIEAACAAPELTQIDLGLGEERYKTAWAAPVPLKDSLLALSFKGHARKQMGMLRLKAKTAVRNSGTLWPLVRRLRRLTSALRST